jgi:hypothetical protein
MPSEIAFRVTAFGEVDQARLEDLRSQLGLRRAGRLTDDEDEQFGYRTERVGDTEVEFTLTRDGVGTWSFWISYEGATPPADALIDQHREAFLQAFRASGLRINSEWRRK